MSSNLQIQRICERCNQPFIARTTKTRFCGLECNRKYYKSQQRALKVQLSDSETFSKRISQHTQEVKASSIKDIMTVSYVAEFLEYSKDTIYDLIAAGKLKAYRPSVRKTRIKKEHLLEYLERDNEGALERKPALIETATANNGALAREECYSIDHLMNMFGKGRDSLYRILREGGVPFIKEGRYVYYSKVESDKLFRKFKARKYVGYVGNRLEMEANQRLAQKRFTITDCYTMDECVRLFGDDRSLLYAIFSRRAVPKIKVGVNTYYLRKSVEKILRQREGGMKSE